MFRTIRSAATVAAVAILLTLASAAAPVQAKPDPTAGGAKGMVAPLAPPASCAGSSVCGYVASEYRTHEGYEWMPRRSYGVCENVHYNNLWSSVYNNSGRTVRLYKGVNCTEGYWVMPNGDGLCCLSIFQPTWNDNIASLRWY